MTDAIIYWDVDFENEETADPIEEDAAPEQPEPAPGGTSTIDMRRRGWYVFPVEAYPSPDGKKGEKEPLVPWRTMSSPRHAWGRKWPGIANATGIDCEKSRIVVIDEDAAEAVREWLGRDLPDTHIIQTHQGHQFYFQAGDWGIRNSTKIAPGVDIRGAGGYVVAEGSAHGVGGPGTYVRVSGNTDVAPMPEWLATTILAAQAAEKAGGGAGGERFEMPDDIPDGERDTTLFRYACSLRARSIRDHEAITLLRDAFNRCSTPFTERTPEEMWSHVCKDYPEGRERFYMDEDDDEAEADTEGEQQEGDAKLPNGWGRVDLGSLLDAAEAGTLELPMPDVGDTADGVPLFYDGRVNGIAGESGGGKTWMALAVGLQEMRKGRVCTLLDFEDGPATAVTRLVDLGGDIGMLRALFDYRQPVKHDPKGIRAMVKEVAGAFVILDSTGESMSAFELKSNDDGEVAAWFTVLARPMARSGCCVVLLDHMAKSSDGGLWPIGSHRKRAGIDGAQYVAEVIEEFSREKNGCVALKVAKDRNGARPRGEVASYVRFTHPVDVQSVSEPVALEDLDLNGDGYAVEIGDDLHIEFGRGRTSAEAAERKAEKAAKALARDVAELNKLNPSPSGVRDVMRRLAWGQARASRAWKEWSDKGK